MAEPTGADTFVVVKTDAGDVTVRTSPQTQARLGDAVGLEFQAARVSWFDAGSGEWGEVVEGKSAQDRSVDATTFRIYN